MIEEDSAIAEDNLSFLEADFAPVTVKGEDEDLNWGDYSEEEEEDNFEKANIATVQASIPSACTDPSNQTATSNQTASNQTATSNQTASSNQTTTSNACYAITSFEEAEDESRQRPDPTGNLLG